MANILLIEDEINLLRLYTKVLQAANHAVIPSATVSSALDTIKRRDIDLCISDLSVGLVSPIHVINELKRIKHKHQIQILIISANVERYAENWRSAGLIHTLAKPFSNYVLVDTVARILDSTVASNS